MLKRTLLGVGVSVVLSTMSTSAWAAVSSYGYPSVRAEVSGKSVPAIAIHNVTYVQSRAFDLLHTPYQYLGNGRFAITGGTVTGVVYKGQPYVPWYTVSSRVAAQHLPGGGWNFVPLPAPHQYHVAVSAQAAGNGPVFSIQVLDGSKGVPHQLIHLHADILRSDGSTDPVDLHPYTDAAGRYQWTGPQTPGTVRLTVTWVDPGGHTDTGSASVTVTAADAATGTLPQESVVAVVPIQIQDDAIFFSASTDEGKPIKFQLDTGAYEPFLPESLAQELHLRKLDRVPVEGVGGIVNAYSSVIPSLVLGGVRFTNVPCIIGPTDSLDTPLFGYRFFVDHGYDLLISNHEQRLYILAHQ